MTRVHALILVVLLVTVLMHVALAGLVSLLSRRNVGRKDSSPSPPGVRPGEPVTKGRRRVGTDRPAGADRTGNGGRGTAVYGTCAGCGLPIAMAHSTRRGPRRGTTPVRAA